MSLEKGVVVYGKSIVAEIKQFLPEYSIADLLKDMQQGIIIPDAGKQPFSIMRLIDNEYRFNRAEAKEYIEQKKTGFLASINEMKENLIAQKNNQAFIIQMLIDMFTIVENIYQYQGKEVFLDLKQISDKLNLSYDYIRGQITPLDGVHGILRVCNAELILTKVGKKWQCDSYTVHQFFLKIISYDKQLKLREHRP
jgi:hypothetical protein